METKIVVMIGLFTLVLGTGLGMAALYKLLPAKIRHKIEHLHEN